MKKEKNKKGNKIKRGVSRKKLETAKKLVELIKDSDSIVIASIKNIPSRQFQSIRKKLKGKAEVKVVKKRVMCRALEVAGKNALKLKNYVQEDSAILFSKLDSFELAGILSENKNPITAKPGQIATGDIEIEAGLTDLTPGPAISELGALGIKIAVEEGKIAIKENKLLVKSGEKINEGAASIMAKLDIKPFDVGLEPIVLYEGKTGKIYTNIKIDKEKTIAEIKINAGKAISFAQRIVYYCRETIGYLLAKANAEYNFINKKIGEQNETIEEKKEVQDNVQQINNQEEK